MGRTSIKVKKPVSPNEIKSAPLHYRDKKQVELDISRVSISKAAAAKLEKRVGTVLSANQELSYYQGFHDISIHSHSTKQLENLALQQLRDFMTPNLFPTMQILRLVPELLQACAPKGIGKHFKPTSAEKASVGQSRKLSGYFALAPIVTLFSHDCQDSRVIVPIIRTVLKEGLSYVIYLYVALVLVRQDVLREKLGASPEEDEVDMALQGLGATLSFDNFADLDRQARRLRSRYPIRSLPSYGSISRYSVLKTGKVVKRSTALHYLVQLDKASKSPKAGILPGSSGTVVALIMGTVALGVLWSRIRK